MHITSALKLPILIMFAFVLFGLMVFPINAKTLDEIEAEIEDKQSELDNLDKELEEAEGLVNYYKSQEAGSSSELENIKNELEQIEAEIQVSETKSAKVNQEFELAELGLQQKELVMGDRIVDIYVYEKQGVIDAFLESGQADNFWKNVKYREVFLDDDLSAFTSLAEEAEEVRGRKIGLEASLAVLEEENERLAARKQELADRMAHCTSMAAYNSDRQSGIRSQMGVAQQAIEGLTAEQQQIVDQETAILINANGGTKPLVSGEFYFYGRGRSIYQGHGLGFSQYGAKGAAEHGWTADNIAKYYYTGSSIGTISGRIEVIGYGSMNIEDYVAGLGEIPDKACGTQVQVNSRPDKYVLDNPGTIWDCWPEEAIKAQVIVARSYGFAYGGAICTTATCQVYKGGQGKKWAADETRSKVIQVGGVVKKTYYSSDNNNGWGTATHRNPMWCGDFYGNCGSGYSWLQSVNDSAFAAKGPYTDWMWRTNSYTLAELQSMLEWYAGAGFTYPKSGDVRGLLNTVGTLQNLQIQRDASGRVARVLVLGSTGSQNVNGDFFKRIQIFWVSGQQPSGEVDPIFSLTYHFVRVP